MTRALDAAVEAETEETVVRPLLLVHFEFDSGDLRLCSGYLPVTFDGEEYTPTGDLGSISPIVEETELNANDIQLKLSGIDATWLSVVLAENIQGRAVTIWDAFTDSSGAIVGGDDGPIPHVFRCDVPEIIEDPASGKAEITITAESVLRRLETGAAGMFTTQWQRRYVTGIDSGFNFINQNQQTEIFWGAERRL